MLDPFEALVHAHRHRVYTFAYYYLRQRETAEDVTQEVLVRLWQNFRDLEADSVLPWLLRVTRNACHDQYRRQRSRRDLLQPEADDGAFERAVHGGPDPAAQAEANDFQGRLEQALRNIADPYRTILILREISELPYEQIGEVLRLPLNTVKVYLHRGRKMLREQLQEVVPS